MSNRLWEFRKHLIAIRMGLFFLISIFIFTVALFSVRELTFFKPTYLLKVKFNFAEGLRPASPVRFCGVDVGEVSKLEVKTENNRPIVYVYTKIQQGIAIPSTSQFFINSLSLFGEKYLEITPVEPSDTFFKPNDIIEGYSPIPLFHIFMTFDQTLKEVQSFVKDGNIKMSFENTLANLEKTSANLHQLLKHINSRQGTLGRLFYDDSVYRKTEELFDDLKANPWKLLYRPKEQKK